MICMIPKVNFSSIPKFTLGIILLVDSIIPQLSFGVGEMGFMFCDLYVSAK